VPQGRHRRRPAPARAAAGPAVAARKLVVFALGATLGLALGASIVAACAAASLRTTLANPGYLMDVLRQEEVLSRTKAEFLDSLVASVDLDPSDQVGLRQALDEGIPVAWMDGQLERALRTLAAHVASGAGTPPSLNIPLTELKAALLAAIREHMDAAYYGQAASGLGLLPDSIDIGDRLQGDTLRRLTPVRRGLDFVLWTGLGLVPLLSGLLWLVLGRGPRGRIVMGAIWLAGGVAAAAAALSGAGFGAWLLSRLPFPLADIGAVSLLEVARVGLDGVRSQLLALATCPITAGLLALGLPKPKRPI
jgi:hypothetical protein